MTLWNFRTPITFLASIIWNISECCDLPLPGDTAPRIFGIIIGSKGRKRGLNKMKELTRYSGTIEIHDFTNMPCATHRVNPKGDWCKASDVVKLEEELHTMKVDRATKHIKAILELNDKDLALVRVYCKEELGILLEDLANDC